MDLSKVGETAGLVWHTLDSKGPQSVAALKKTTKASDMVLHMALGWLAREDKIDLVKDGRILKISLK